MDTDVGDGTADVVAALLARIGAVDGTAAAAAAARHARLIKPPGSLGRLEDVGARLAAIAGVNPPPVPSRPAVVVFAADHGVHVQRVTAWPQHITTVMVEQFCAGAAAVNALAGVVGAEVVVVDVGCVAQPAAHPRLRSCRVRAGTDDLAIGPAMTLDDARRAFVAGARVAGELVAAGADLLITGDMGIANTTASACVVAALTGASPETVTGRGAGVDDATLRTKRDVVAAAVARERSRSVSLPADSDRQQLAEGDDPLATVAALGGLEHAALAGLLCAAAAGRVPVVLDGVTTNAAALVAVALEQAVADYLIAGHRSTEPGATVALDHLGLVPLLDLQLRVGEGTGGLLAVPLVRAAAAALRDMATLDALGPLPSDR